MDWVQSRCQRCTSDFPFYLNYRNTFFSDDVSLACFSFLETFFMPPGPWRLGVVGFRDPSVFVHALGVVIFTDFAACFRRHLLIAFFSKWGYLRFLPWVLLLCVVCWPDQGVNLTRRAAGHDLCGLLVYSVYAVGIPLHACFPEITWSIFLSKKLRWLFLLSCVDFGVDFLVCVYAEQLSYKVLTDLYLHSLV